MEKFSGYHDVAILSHVFEHLRMDLLGSLRAIRNTLQPGGILILETPNLFSAKGWHSMLRKKVACSCAGSVYHEWSKIEKLGFMGHVRKYSLFELKQLMQNTGFDVVSEEFLGYWGGGGNSKKLIRLLQKNFLPSLRQNIQIVARV